MIIVYAVTVMKNESLEIIKKNIQSIQTLKNIQLKTIINTNKKVNIKNALIINKVGDMQFSRESLLKAASQYKADCYFVFDSDILLPKIKLNQFIEQIIHYKLKYDFISLYYKLDPPIPTFFTLSSSLNDFYNLKSHKNKSVDIPTFDDSDFNNSHHLYPNKSKPNKKLNQVLKGRSYLRDIPEFTNKIDENDTTTGGATVYFSKKMLKKKYNWKKYNGKSLTWYDSYRTWELSKKYKFAKVPIFVNHKRHDNSNQLSWEDVIRYVKGFNLYMSKKSKNFNQNALPLHVIELYMFIKGIIKKIHNLKKLTIAQKNTIKFIEQFMDINIKKIYERIKQWK